MWCGSQEIPLPGKAFALLRYLVEHAGQLVSKAELFTALWPGTVVTDGALTYCVGEVRTALGDNPKAPQYIETVPRRGFRFIAKVVSRKDEQPEAKSKEQGTKVGTPSPAPDPQQPLLPVVGREFELAQLHHLLDKVLSGERQLIFVTGEPGIGKTTLIDAFRQRLETRGWRLDSSPQASSLKPLASSVSFAHGQCIEHYGSGEAFLPVLDALGRLARGAGSARLIALLRTYAPMWLVQLPAFIDEEEVESLQRKVQRASRERMLREMAEVLERLAVEQPVILILEDLHWSDVSTLDLLAFLARRKQPARLLVLGTYRPVEMLSEGRPLQGITQELYAHRLATELLLPLLSEAETAAYLAAELSHPFSLTYALGCAGMLHLLRQEGNLARERAEAVITVSTKEGFPSWSAVGRMTRGGALVTQGQLEEGIVQLCQVKMSPFSSPLLAEAYGKMGQVNEGLTILAKAQAVVDKTGERVYEAELYRLKGELTLQQFKVQGSKFKVEEEAEACFLKAIDIARKQSAKSWELRATMSLVRLRREQAKQKASCPIQHETPYRLTEAHKMLTAIYNWFTEGFDTKDLQEAKVLLEALSR